MVRRSQPQSPGRARQPCAHRSGGVRSRARRPQQPKAWRAHEPRARTGREACAIARADRSLKPRARIHACSQT
eukprot:6191388-Pleurochrysis_carterae.AAC.1